MSEWFDNLKKPSSNFRKSLQEHADKKNTRRKLTAEDAKRQNKLETIVEKRRRSENVQNRQLQT